MYDLRLVNRLYVLRLHITKILFRSQRWLFLLPNSAPTGQAGVVDNCGVCRVAALYVIAVDTLCTDGCGHLALEVLQTLGTTDYGCSSRGIVDKYGFANVRLSWGYWKRRRLRDTVHDSISCTFRGAFDTHSLPRDDVALFARNVIGTARSHQTKWKPSRQTSSRIWRPFSYCESMTGDKTSLEHRQRTQRGRCCTLTRSLHLMHPANVFFLSSWSKTGHESANRTFPPPWDVPRLTADFLYPTYVPDME